MVAGTYSNPLGRASLAMPVSNFLDRASAAIVPVHRTSEGLVRVSNDPSKAIDIARRSRLHPGPEQHGNIIQRLSGTGAKPEITKA